MVSQLMPRSSHSLRSGPKRYIRYMVMPATNSEVFRAGASVGSRGTLAYCWISTDRISQDQQKT